LWIAATIFFQKLQISGDSKEYMMFPVNWLANRLDLTDIYKLYNLFVTTAFNSLRSIHPELGAVLRVLEQWVLSIPSIPALPLLPPRVIHFPDFPRDTVLAVGQKLNRAWNAKEQFRELVRAIARLPLELGQAFGFKSVVYVFDHFDICDVIVSHTHRFTPPHESVTLSTVLWDELARSVYFVATRNDSVFFELWPRADFRQLPTERIITDTSSKQLMVAEPSITLKYSMCNGCPGYCALFDRVYDFVQKSQKKKDMKLAFTQLRSVVDDFRQRLAREEIQRLCTLLALGDSGISLQNDDLNALAWRKHLDIVAKE
jgi:hypothetical protein